MPIVQPPLTTGTITANAQTVSGDVTGYSAAQLSVHGTYAGVNLTFEGSDDAGTTWYGLQAVRAADATLEATSGVLTNTSRLWYVPAGALTTVRVRATAYSSGTATIGITPVHDVDSLLGTASADVLTVQGIASGTPLLVTSTPPAAATTPTRLIKTVAATGTPEAIAAASTFFQSATIIGNKAARTANTGTVYLGVTSADDTQLIAIGSGSLITVQAPAGQKFDLGSFYVDVLNAGDGVAVVYS